MKNLFIFLFIFNLSTSTIWGQSFPSNEVFTVTIDGYIINMGGLKLFQPCEDSSVTFLESIDSRSFNLWADRNDLYLEAIDKMGDSILVKVYDSTDNKFYQMNVSYFYCSLKIELLFLNNDFEVLKKPSYEFCYKGKKYNLRYFFVRNKMLAIIPKSERDLLKLYNYYLEGNYVLPNWLLEIRNR